MDKKYIEKSWHKINGIVHVVEETIYGAVLVLKKGGKAPRYIPLTVGKNNGELYEQARVLKKGDRVKCRFLPTGAEHKGRWYANLNLKEILPWPVGENKKKKMDAQEKQNAESEYKKGATLFSWGNSEFTNEKKDA